MYDECLKDKNLCYWLNSKLYCHFCHGNHFYLKEWLTEGYDYSELYIWQTHIPLKMIKVSLLLQGKELAVF